MVVVEAHACQTSVALTHRGTRGGVHLLYMQYCRCANTKGVILTKNMLKKGYVKRKGAFFKQELQEKGYGFGDRVGTSAYKN